MIRHAMNLLGICEKQFSPKEIKAGFTVTLIDWRGCMAEVRHVSDVGEVTRHESVEDILESL